MDIVARLKQLAHAVADQNWNEFSMRIPADPERDADLVILSAAKEIEALRAELAECKGDAQRPPTPVGWSDTDWIKHLQEQEGQHPLEGLHINQGSLDAAADAYEAEYNEAQEARRRRSEMSRLGSLYILLGEPDGEIAGCCELSEWAANEIDRLRAELVSWRKAFGLLTTLHGSMPIDISDPLRMAKSIEVHVRAELAEYKRDAERYRTALEQIVAPFEDLNFVSGNKLLTYIHDVATAAIAAKEEE